MTYVTAETATVPPHQDHQRQLLESALADACAWHRVRGLGCAECIGGARSECGSCTADSLAIYVFTHLAHRPGRFRPELTPGELITGKREIIADAVAKAHAYRYGRPSPIDQALAAAYAELARHLG